MTVEHKLRHFVWEAKVHTYASGGNGGEDAARPGVKTLPYEKEGYLYLDSYYGDAAFLGQEAVWHHGSPVWGMNYYGAASEPIAGFPEFLLEALRNNTVEAPYRGPAYYRSGDFEYRCVWDGGFDRFSGKETIHYEGREIYKLRFHGGNIRFE